MLPDILHICCRNRTLRKKGSTMKYRITTIPENLLFIILLSLPFQGLFAQSFRGLVLDAASGNPVPFAVIYLDELQSTAVTDVSGIFTFRELPPEALQIHISYVGYKTLDAIIDVRQRTSDTFRLETAHTRLKELVISVPHGKLEYENVVAIERQQLERLRNAAPLTLAAAVSAIPGVALYSTGPGIGKPVIRGLSGNRIVTYAQNIRIENQQWGDEHGLGVGEIGIESVEVIKGPASLLYGADALGGVMYFVDERYAPQGHYEARAAVRLHSNDLSGSSDFAFKVNRKNVKFNLFASAAGHGDYQVPDASRIYNTRFSEENLKAAFGYNKGIWISNLRYSYLINHFGISEGDSVYLGAGDYAMTLPFQRVAQQTLSWENTLYTGDSKWKMILGLTDNRRMEFEDDAQQPALDMQLQTGTYDLKWYSAPIGKKLTLIGGSQGMWQLNGNRGPELLIPDARTLDFGLFLMANIEVRKLTMQAGLRFDQRSILTEEQLAGSILFPALKRSFRSPNFSFGASYRAGHFTLRSNWSSGFRAPNASELLSNGVHEGTLQYVLGNTELRSEEAAQSDLSLAFENEHIEFQINPFFNVISNYIFLAPLDSVVAGVPLYRYEQADARLYGGEAMLHIHPHAVHWLHLESSLSSVWGRRADAIPLPRIPAVRILSSISASWTAKKHSGKGEVFLNHQYYFAQRNTAPFESATGPYGLTDAGISYVLESKGRSFRIKSGVRNLFNTRYIPHLSRFKPMGIPNPGRNFYLSLEIALNGNLREREERVRGGS